jgi:guanylate kinase
MQDSLNAIDDARFRAGSLLVIVAPSGAGKTSLVRALITQRPSIQLSISFTTRQPRPGEHDGVDYFFVSHQEFEQRRAAGEFLESAEVHGNLYATSKAWLDSQMSAGNDVLLEIDYQGAEQVKAIFPQAVGIFIAPPSLQVLRERLIKRAQDSQAVIARRLHAASQEMAQVPNFEYVIINQDFASALGQLLHVVDASSLRYFNQRARFPELFASWEAVRTN